ncbi:PREDICTED: testis- and ovary-specific PAZ domain-containing protein 1, partial [Acanthisitta chloris]|uniref:testis- and ovary-specific PAZ domain-containing protein 1 n=1 Tax=Acanthisitta chloris TaxID=57068 RepID=UPI0004F0EA19
GIKRKELGSEDPNLSGSQEGLGSSDKEGHVEIKLQIPSSEEEVESAARHGVPCSPELEVLQPGKVTCNIEMEYTASVMIENTQIPDPEKNLGTQESMSKPKPQEEVDTPEKLDGCPLGGSRKLGTQEEEKRCLSKKGRTALKKPKLCSPGKRGSSALPEVHTQCPESSKGDVSTRKRNKNAVVSQQLQGLSGQEQPATRRKTRRCCMKEEQQSSSPWKGADSLEKSAKEQLKAVEQDSGTQAVKKLETKQNRSEDSEEKEPHYSQSPMVATLGGTQSKSFPCRAVTKKSGVQYKKRKPRTGQIKHLQSCSVTAVEKVVNTSAECDAEHCRNALNHCNGLLCAREQNPFVRSEDCSSCINALGKSSASATTSSYKLDGFFHVAQDKRNYIFPDGTEEHSDKICSTSRMQNEKSAIKGGLLSNEEKIEHREGCFSGCQSENNKCLRGKKCNTDGKPRKKVKIAEKSAVQNTCTDECSELQTDAATALSSSFAVSELNCTLSAVCDLTSRLHIGENTCEAQNVSAWRKNSTKLLAFENGSKKSSEVSVIAEGEGSSSVAHHLAASDSLRVLAQVHDISACNKSKPGRTLNNVSRKSWQFTCQRAVPMAGKRVWPLESCARASEWVHKNHGSMSEGKRLLKAAFDNSSDISSLKVVGNSAVTENLRQLDLHMSSSEITKESTPEKVNSNIECQTSLETPECSSVVIYEALRMSNGNGEPPVNTDTSAVTFNHVLEAIAKQKDKSEGDVARRNLPVTVENGSAKQEDKNEGDVRKRNLSVAVQSATSTGDTNRIDFSPKVSVVKQTFSDLKPMKVLNPGNLTKFKIPLCRNKTESRKMESAHSFKRKACSPLELLESTDVSRRQKTGVETTLVNSEQQPLPVMGEASIKKRADEIDVKDLQHNGSDNLSNEMFVFPGSFSSYPSPLLDGPPFFSSCPSPLLDGPPKSSVPDCCGTECVPKSNFPDRSWNSVDHLVELEINDDSKSRGSLSQQKSQNLPDILEAYKQDVLVIDVIQDDPDLFGTSDEGELALARCKKCPVKASNSIKGTERDITPECPVTSEESYSGDNGFSDCKSKDLENCELLSRLPVNDPKVNIFSEATVMRSWTNGYKPSGKSPLLPLRNCGGFEPWKMEKNATASRSVQQILDALDLPHKYCRYYFMTSRGCKRTNCCLRHVPEQRDEKICMAILRTYIDIKESGLLKRAVQIFVQYYRGVIPGVDFASQVLNDLLVSLLKNCLLQEVFQILNVTVQIKTVPAVDVLLKVFEHVASLNIRDAVPTLISTFCKLIDAGMFPELEHFDCIIKLLNQLQVSSWEISTVLNIKSRFKERHFETKWLFDFNLAVAEIQHCKEKSDWAKLGALYLRARTGCERFDDMQKLLLSIAEILAKDAETQRPGVPFCDFADAVIKYSQNKEADRLFLGRTGISVMYSYHKVLQWIKGRKVLNKLNELQIRFTLLKGLVGAGKLASRCQIVNKAAEILLNAGSLHEATWVLRESEWTTNSPLWPCDKMDIINRHNLLCTLVHKYLRKSLYRQAFEVLQNLPGFQMHSDAVDVSQYSCLFNELINACFGNKNLGVSSSAVDFMLSKNIAIKFPLLRRLITALGRSSLWSKARTYYKSALSLGCYPQLQGNLHHKLLNIPSYLSEVEMLLAIEIFLVSNASDILSSMTTSQTLQIILKRCEDQTHYQVAVQRLILAARLSDPKLFLKHLTMNINMEEVYSLELFSALKWLQENMKWAEKVWLFQ